MKLTIDPRDLPRYTDEKTEPIDLPGGLVLRLGMEYDQDSSPMEWMGKIVHAEGVDTLWEELLEAIENDVLQPFQNHLDYGHVVETDDFDFADANYKEPPGVYIDSGGRDGWGRRDEHRWFESSYDRGDETDEDRRKYSQQDAVRIRRWLNDDWCFVGLTADITFDGAEVGSAGRFGVESDCGAEYHQEMFQEIIQEAWFSAQAEILKLGMRLAELQNIPELKEELEVDYGSDAS